MSKRMIAISFILVLGVSALFVSEFASKNKPLTVYSGKGLKKAMEEVKTVFEQRHDIELNIIYAGSGTCLGTIKETRKGDIYIPGAVDFIEENSDLVENYQYVALHVPMVCIHKDNQEEIRSFNDLAKPGVRLTVGNSKMCSMGKVADEIISKSELKEGIAKNVVIKSPTVVELLNLVIKKEVDAAIIWKDTMRWPESKDLKGIEIPPDINSIQEIHVAVLSMSEHKKNAQLFADFVASEGKTIFEKHGFGKK